MKINKTWLAGIFILLASPLLHASSSVPDSPQIRHSALPNALKSQAQPRYDLVWSARNGNIMVTNTGLEKVHLAKQVLLLPGKLPLSLMKPYLLPGETLAIHNVYRLERQNQVMITPLSEEGKAATPQLFDLKP